MAPTERNNSENDINLFNSSKSKQFSSECIKNNSINESRQRSRKILNKKINFSFKLLKI